MSKPIFVKGTSSGFCRRAGAVIHSYEHCCTRGGKINPIFTPESIVEMLDKGGKLCLSCWDHQHPADPVVDLTITDLLPPQEPSYVKLMYHCPVRGFLPDVVLCVPPGYRFEYLIVPDE